MVELAGGDGEGPRVGLGVALGISDQESQIGQMIEAAGKPDAAM